MPKIVWVLGAGFSRPLGGPVLDQLFTEGLEASVRAAFPDTRYPRLHERAAKYIGPFFRKHKDVHWVDAEDFLDRLDLASRDDSSPSAKIVLELVRASGSTPLMGLEPRALASAARRVMAAQCSAFLAAADRGTERWAPYREWATRLCDGDSIITFNYDRTLEVLSPRLEIVAPGQRPFGNGPRVYKLHGSVDWIRTKTGDTYRIEIRHDIPDAALQLDDDQLFIATPGPTKKETTEQVQELWTDALNELKTASVIVFVGYRFPESDAIARRCIIDAVAQNHGSHLAAHTVLGADTRHHHSVRLLSLLTHAMRLGGRTPAAGPGGGRTFNIVQHPMWAQDFLDIVPTGTLSREFNQRHEFAGF